MLMAYEKIGYSIADGIATIELDDPPANTYSYEMMREIDAAVLDARMDRAVHVIVITGAGEKFFCAGANIGMLKDAAPAFKYYFCLHANETLNRLEQTPKLVIAALNGHTVGGGLEVAMAADIRIARHGAGKIGMPGVALGVLPGTGGRSEEHTSELQSLRHLVCRLLLEKKKKKIKKNKSEKKKNKKEKEK